MVIHIDQGNPHTLVSLGNHAVLALKIWKAILMRNTGCPYVFVLDQLPYAHKEIFVDVSSSVGIEGFQGTRYSSFRNHDLRIFQDVHRIAA